MFTVYNIGESVFAIIRKEDYDEATETRNKNARRHGFIAVVGDSYEGSIGVFMSLSDELVESNEIDELEKQARRIVFKED